MSGIGKEKKTHAKVFESSNAFVKHDDHYDKNTVVVTHTEVDGEGERSFIQIYDICSI